MKEQLEILFVKFSNTNTLSNLWNKAPILNNSLNYYMKLIQTKNFSNFSNIYLNKQKIRIN